MKDLGIDEEMIAITRGCKSLYFDNGTIAVYNNQTLRQKGEKGFPAYGIVLSTIFPLLLCMTICGIVAFLARRRFRRVTDKDLAETVM
mgnify:CR=1 FL=1